MKITSSLVCLITGTSQGFGLHLLLGPDAYAAAVKQLEALSSNFETWRELTCSTDFRK